MIPIHRLTILDVGHGNSAVLEDEGRVVIFDAGTKHGLLNFLTEQNISRIDVILLSHADADHIGGLVGVLSSGLFQIGEIRVNTDALKNSKLWDALIYELHIQNRQKTIKFVPSLTDSDNGSFDSKNVKIEILAPSTYIAGKGVGSTDRSGRKIETNSISAVIRIIFKGTPILLLPGDIDDVGLDNLLELDVEIKTRILVFPHHGGKAGRSADMIEFTKKLCNAVQPRQVIFSIDREKTHLQPEVISTIRSNIRGVRIACTQLSKLCAIAAPTSVPTHLNNNFAAGREYRHCCAGTVTFSLTEPDNISPKNDEHLEFIRRSAPTALCGTNQ